MLRHLALDLLDRHLAVGRTQDVGKRILRLFLTGDGHKLAKKAIAIQAAIIDDIFLRCLARLPTAAEKAALRKRLETVFSDGMAGFSAASPVSAERVPAGMRVAVSSANTAMPVTAWLMSSVGASAPPGAC